MTSLERTGPDWKGRSVISLAIVLLGNAVMTVLQVNIASLYLPISITFNEQLVGLGVLTSVFFLGLGVVEVPGGVVGARIGAKSLATAGLVLGLVALVASGLAPNFEVLIALRFAAGAGMGLFFPAAVVLTIRSMGEESSGLAAALVTASFAVGASLGIFGWSVLSSEYGWRASFFIQAAIQLVVAVLFVLLVAGDRPSSGLKLTLPGLKRVLANRKLATISLALFGSGITGGVANTFMVYYLEEVFKLQAGYAGLISGVGNGTLLVTALLGGRLFDRGWDPRFIVFGSTAVLSLGAALVAVHSVGAALAGALVCGLAIGPISTVAFVLARRTAPAPELETLVVSVADNLSLAGVFVGVLVFPLLVLVLGYPAAWLIAGVLATVFTIPVVLIKKI